MPFHEVLFPADISYGSSGGAAFKTTIFTSDSGYEQRNVDWSLVRCQYDVSQGIKSIAQMTVLTQFFMARNGRAYGFRFFDWNDYLITDVQIGAGDGTTTTFQLVNVYVSAQEESGQSYQYVRPITKPAWGTLSGMTVGGVAKVEGTDFTLDYTTGIFTFNTAPAGPTGGDPGAAVVVGACQFHVPVRFDVDHLDITQEFWETSSWPNITLVEVRDWGQVVTANTSV